jgi:hypothetical protein
MLLAGGNFFEGPVNKYVPNFLWRTPALYGSIRYTAPVVSSTAPAQTYSSPTPTPSPPMAAPVPVFPVTGNNYAFTLAVNDTIAIAWTLMLGFLVGIVGILIYGSMIRDDQKP